MQKVIYVPPWDTLGGDDNVVLQLDRPVILGTVSGTSGTDVNILSSKIPGMDGVYVHDVKLESGLIKAKVNVYGQDRREMYENRFKLIRCLTAKPSPGTEYYYNDYISAKIGAIPQSSPQFTARIKNYNAADVVFFCPDPRWQSLDEQKVKIAWLGDAFEFPIAIDPTMRFGVIPSGKRQRDLYEKNRIFILRTS